MSEKEIKKENNEPDINENEDEVEGYAYCSSSKNKCLTDCIIPPSSPSLSELN